MNIPLGSTIINLDGKNVGTFGNIITRDGIAPFMFGQHSIKLLWHTAGYQVWQGDVDERDLAEYPQWFSRNLYSK